MERCSILLAFLLLLQLARTLAKQDNETVRNYKITHSIWQPGIAFIVVILLNLVPIIILFSLFTVRQTREPSKFFRSQFFTPFLADDELEYLDYYDKDNESKSRVRKLQTGNLFFGCHYTISL
jgi:hypothetical protein